MNGTPPRSYPDKLLDEISRRVYYKAMEKLDAMLSESTIDTEKLDAISNSAAAASAQINEEVSEDDDGGEF